MSPVSGVQKLCRANNPIDHCSCWDNDQFALMANLLNHFKS